MKKFTLLALLATLSIGCFANKYDLKFKYNGLQGAIDSVKISRTEGIKIDTVLVFDQNGLIKEERKRTQNQHSVRTYTRDEATSYIVGYEYKLTEDGKLEEHLKADGKIIDQDHWEMAVFDQKTSKLVRNITTEAKSFSHFEESTVVEAYGDTYMIRYAYDKEYGNNLFQRTFDSEGNWYRSFDCTFDDAQRCTQIKNSRKRRAQVFTNYKYVKFDENGNWTEREVTIGGKPSHTEYQTIYYRK